MSYKVGEAPRDFLFFVIVKNIVKRDTARDGEYSFIGFSVKNYQVSEKRRGPNGPQNCRVGCWLVRIWKYDVFNYPQTVYTLKNNIKAIPVFLDDHISYGSKGEKMGLFWIPALL